jgi:uncharacterized protein
LSGNGYLARWRGRFGDSRLAVLLEAVAIAAVFLADWRHHIYFSKTPYLLALGWVSLRARGMRWRDVGLRIPPNWRRQLLIGVAAGVAMEVLELFFTQPILVMLTGRYPDLSELRVVVGNIPALLLMIVLAWTLAAVGEELVWRGYIFNRFSPAKPGDRPRTTAMTLIAVSAAFGLAHLDQGITGVIENCIDGLLLGYLYLKSGRNLLAPIAAHGITDTIDALVIFSGHYPGM